MHSRRFHTRKTYNHTYDKHNVEGSTNKWQNMTYPNKTNFGVIVCTTNIHSFIEQCVITPSDNTYLTRFFTHHGTFEKQ